MAAVVKHTLHDLNKLVKDGHKYKLFKPFFLNGQILLNIEKVLTEKDLFRLEGKVFGPIEVIPAVEHSTNSKIRGVIAENMIKILKTSPTFNQDDKQHIDYSKRKECEKLINGIIKENAHLAEKLLDIYKYSKKLFIHSVKVGIIAVVIEIGRQQKQKIHNALLIEELFTAALLHDLGFMKLPKEMIEKKRYEFTADEKELYKNYPNYGQELALEMGDSIRKRSADVIAQHQERLPGNGFPKQLKDDKIDQLALIIALADDFELLLSKESAKHNKSGSELLSRISRSGHIYGSDIVDSFYTWFRYLK